MGHEVEAPLHRFYSICQENRIPHASHSVAILYLCFFISVLYLPEYNYYELRNKQPYRKYYMVISLSVTRIGKTRLYVAEYIRYVAEHN